MRVKNLLLFFILLISFKAWSQLGLEDPAPSAPPPAPLRSTDEPVEKADGRRIRRHVSLIVGVNHDEEFLIPYAAKGVIGEIRDRARVLDESYDERGVILKVRGQSEQIDRLRALVKKQTDPHR